MCARAQNEEFCVCKGNEDVLSVRKDGAEGRCEES